MVLSEPRSAEPTRWCPPCAKPKAWGCAHSPRTSPWTRMPCHLSSLPSAFASFHHSQSDRKLNFPSFLGSCCHLSLTNERQPLSAFVVMTEKPPYRVICVIAKSKKTSKFVHVIYRKVWDVFKDAFPHVPLHPVPGKQGELGATPCR